MIRSLALAVSFGVILAGSGLTIAEDKPVDWSKFHSSGKVKAVVEKVDGDSVTVSVPKLERNKTSGYRGGRNRRPSVKVGHEDIDIPYAANGLVRWEKLPKKADGKEYTSKELEKARLPIGATGYAAERSDLKPGHIVELHLVHPSDIPDSKLTDKDIVIKYVVIEGETKAPAHASKSDTKKK